ncbi:TIGR00269 family protein [Candidatus Pacearchaeota archaeon]|nr:TIGR00269 family protein [Candidatus Pacearchaeota archaeon]
MDSSNKFIQNFEARVLKTIKEYRLAKKGDRIVIAMSGGKDSAATAYLLNKFAKKLGCKIAALHINLHIGNREGYSERCLQAVEKFCSANKIKLNVYDIKKEAGCSICYIRSGVQQRLKLKNCAVCGVVKKWIFNREARRLKAGRIATGHNLDDEAQTVLMNFFKGNLMLNVNSGPATGIIEDKKFVQRIKPLYFMPEDEIRKYSMLMKLPVVYEKCPCAIDSYRIVIRRFLNKFDNSANRRIVDNFAGMLPLLRKKAKSGLAVKYCQSCGEPSRNEICKRCQMTANL